MSISSDPIRPATVWSSRAATVWSTMLVGVLALGWLVVSAGPASAHAVLTSADPQDRAQLDEPPASVTLTFNEPVEAASDALRVFDADAERVDDGIVDGTPDSIVEVELPDDLPDGGYVVTYRVVSTDSHPVAGVLTFTVGDADEVTDDVVAELFGGSGVGLTGWLGPVLRGLGYAATLLAAGALVFSVAVARGPADRGAARRIGVRAALAGVVLALLAVPVQAAAVSGVGLVEALAPSVLGEALMSSFGLSSLVRAAALVWLAVLWRPGIVAWLPGAAALAATASYILDGHQRSVEPTWLLMGGDVVHLSAAAVWFAGLILLVGAMRRRRLDDDPVDAAALVARFSSIALVSVAAVSVAGVAMAVPLVGSFDALTSTTYGWLLIAKVAAVGVVVLIAAYNRQRLVPAITVRAAPAGGSVDAPATSEERHAERSRDAWRRLSTTVRLEAGVIVAVMLVTGVLVSTQPAADAGGLGGLYETTAELGDGLDVSVIVDPNRAGRNAIHVYVLEQTGRPTADVEDLELELTYLPEGIGPIPIDPFPVGPGHWTATIDDLAFAGDWEIRMVAGIDRFTELQTTVTVPVAP